MAERKYTFRYKGIAPEVTSEPVRRIDNGLTVIDLYRRKSERGGIWWVEINFPPPTQALEQTRPCSSFLDLVGMIEESDALERFSSGSRNPDDDLLILRRQLREARVQEPEICPADRVLVYKAWDYDVMKVLMRSHNLIPNYDCSRCGESNEVADYSKMISSAIVYIADRASSYNQAILIEI